MTDPSESGIDQPSPSPNSLVDCPWWCIVDHQAKGKIREQQHVGAEYVVGLGGRQLVLPSNEPVRFSIVCYLIQSFDGSDPRLWLGFSDTDCGATMFLREVRNVVNVLTHLMASAKAAPDRSSLLPD